MTSQALEEFRQSMKIGYMEWHDGIGYDLEALALLTHEERQAAEDLVVARNLADWRDLEALDFLGTDRALQELRLAIQAKSVDIRIEAARRLAARKLISDPEVEAIIVEALEKTTILDGMTKTLAFASANPTPAVRRQLLHCALRGNDDIRVHAAALVHFLYGKSSSHFDMRFRSFYLRFGSADRSKRLVAYRELCAQIDVVPQD